jgi:hypothetical protein
MSHLAAFPLVALFILLTPLTALAQADVWAISWPQVASVPIRLVRANLDTLETQVMVEFPNPHCLGGSAASSDGSIFYLVAGSDLHRFDIRSATQLPTVTSPVSCEDGMRMHVSPDDRWWYFRGIDGLTTRYSIVDANTRQVVHTESDESVRFVVFTPDGSLRFEARSRLVLPRMETVRAVMDPASTTAFWQFNVGDDIPSVGDMTATNTTLYVLLQHGNEYRIRAYDAWTGAEQAHVRVSFALGNVPMRIRAAHGRLYLAGARHVESSVHLIVATYDLTSLAPGPSVSHPIGLVRFIHGDVAFSPDKSLFHFFPRIWYTDRPEFDLRHTVFDADSLRVLSDTSLAPDTTVSHLAFSSTPGAPTISDMAIEDGHVRARWQPTSGPAPRWFLIRGARRGEPASLVAIAAGAQREWRSPPLPLGSYTLELAAVNSAGTSARSVPFEFSVGAVAAPGPPTDLWATTADDTTHLTWRAAAGGAAPTRYIVEAAPAGLATFIEVTRVTLPELRASRIPSGTWHVRIRAFTAGGVSAPSNVITITAQPCSAVPSAPGALEAIVTGRVVTLRWTAPAAGGVEDYIIEAGTASGVFNLGRFASARSDPSIEVIAPAGAYYVRVRGRNTCGEGAPSNEVVVSVG